jgi:hypothetical protein
MPKEPKASTRQDKYTIFSKKYQEFCTHNLKIKPSHKNLSFLSFIWYNQCMTITQTVTIPDDRRIMIEIPRDTPTGEAQVIIQFPVKEKTKAEPQPRPQGEGSPLDSNGKIRFTKKELEEMLHDSEALSSITGIIKTDMTLDEIRTERLSKHL